MKSFFEKLKKGSEVEDEEEIEPEKEEKKSKKEEERELEAEGQLAIDVYQTEVELIIQSTIAGVKGEDVDINIEGDKVTIRGKRERPNKEEKINYFYQECYWGPFSREIILPVEIDPTRAEATFKEGVLTIRMPKIDREKKRKILVKL